MSRKVTLLEKFVGVLNRAGERWTAEEVADLLWLAAKVPRPRAKAPKTQQVRLDLPPPTPPTPPIRQTLRPDVAEKFGPSTSTSATQVAGSTSSTSLYPQQAGNTSDGVAARAIRSPAALALPGTLSLGRSLRPLKRRVPSRTRSVLDEEATAHRIAESGDWTPVFTPAPERWLDLVLVVDESPSMVIWEKTITELQRLLERQGAFRSIRVLGFQPAADASELDIYHGIGLRAERARSARPRELADSTGRQLVAVISDCVSPPWHDGRMASHLFKWGRFGLAVIAQVLPERLWVRTGLRTYPSLFMRSPVPGSPNAAFDIEWTNFRPNANAPRGTAIPVVSLEAISLGYWARAVSGHSNLWIPGVSAMQPVQSRSAHVPKPVVPAPRTAVERTPVPADQLVRLFNATASPTARRLASLFAAVPLTLPVMRLVQRSLLPESNLVHLAEVWLSGLIDRPREFDPLKSSDTVEYAFVSGVRELLLNNLRLGEVTDVLDAVSNYVGERFGQPLDFGALIADPNASGELKITEGYQSFARVAANALRRFGGSYAELAGRMEVSLYGNTVQTVEQTTDVSVQATGGVAPASDAALPQRTGRTRAVLVGINKYSTTKLPSLAGAVNDVQATREWLQNRFAAPDSVFMLLDAAATKKGVLNALRRCIDATQEGDQVYFHFSGYDQPIATSDPHEADGLEETLVLFDSVPGERASLLTFQELADFAADIEKRGGRSTLVIDSCRSASGVFARRALRHTLLFAASAEMEMAREVVVGSKTHGIFSQLLSEVMRAATPTATWLDVHDQLLARLRTGGYDQTPQLIGRGDVTIFGHEHRSVPPYLLITKANDREIEVHAPSALCLDEDTNTRLAIYPPGSEMMEQPIAFATVVRATNEGFAASLNARTRILPGYRARVERSAQASPFTVTRSPEGDFSVLDEDGNVYWREEPIPGQTITETLQQSNAIANHMSAFVRTFRLQNTDAQSELTGKIDIELITSSSADAPLTGTDPLLLRLRNRGASGLYVSVFMLDDFLGIERIFPATTSCVVLGKDREVTLALTNKPDAQGKFPSRMTFKVFASANPADVNLVSQPRLSRSVDLTKVLFAPPKSHISAGNARQETTRASRKTSASPVRTLWAPGGPVAFRGKLWPSGTTLRVRFLDGSEEMRKRVMAVAEEWTRYANLTFKLVQSGAAELRISVKQDGYWSYSGTDSLSVAEEEPTISLGGLSMRSSQSEVRMVVLRQFGNALGLGSSQRSPLAVIPWRKQAAYKQFATMGWTKQDVNENLFKQYAANAVITGGVSGDSIMYDGLPAGCVETGFEIHTREDLSKDDKAFLALIYPKALENSETSASLPVPGAVRSRRKPVSKNGGPTKMKTPQAARKSTRGAKNPTRTTTTATKQVTKRAKRATTAKRAKSVKRLHRPAKK